VVSHARRWGARVADIALTIAAVIGTVCIVLVIAAALFDVRVILFSTGSMSPTIPTGSAAIVHGIPASDIAVGDVVTVERPGALPLTHRVTSVSTAPDLSADARVITMRGDANDADDPFPYPVEHVRRVVFAVPGAASVIAGMGNPWVLGSVTVAATALVVAVFWPRRRRAEASVSASPPADDDSGSHPRRRTTRSRRTDAVAAVAFVAAGLLALPLGASPARAASTTVAQGDVIRLVSMESPHMRALRPGTSAVWQVGISTTAATPGQITVRHSARGAALGLRYRVEVCARQWTPTGCPPAHTQRDGRAQGETLRSDATLPLDGIERDLLRMPHDVERWLRIEVSMPDDADTLVGEVALTVRAIGIGDDVSIGDDGQLPVTGGAPSWLMAVFGAALLTAGLTMLARGRRP